MSVSLLPDPGLIAILRGVTPDEVLEIGEALYDAGFRHIEVPMNSPKPIQSITRLASAFAGRAVIGAGTVTAAAQVYSIADAGGQLIISPHTDPVVIAASKDAGLISLPGAFTPSECYQALNTGADGLKIFPASHLAPEGLRSMRAVLPPATKIYAVGGIDGAGFADWLAAGANGFGLGNSLYRPGVEIAQIKVVATQMMTDLHNAAEGLS
ncbi:MAG: 2-dehydro-3-deoxy-6-phosphogalactonate aldolase [Pseudomonadota bacterium]